MENKYYTPNIEDLHIGYECELWYNQAYTSENWEPYIFTNKSFRGDFSKIDEIYEENIDNIRTSYLTKEQIEKEGWKTRKTSFDIIFFDKEKYELEFRPLDKTISVGEDLYYPSYTGNCPSINELRKIIKLLNIK